MIALADFAPFVLPFADSCPEFVIQDAVLATVQDFYRQTKEKEVEPPAIDIVAGQSVYTLAIENAHVFEIPSALHGTRGLDPGDPAIFVSQIGADWRARTGSPTHYYMPGLDQIRLVVAPDVALAGGLVLSCVTYPSHTATSFDDILLEEHRDLIVHGALSRLLTQQDRPWFDFKQGIGYGMAYQAAVDKHTSRVNHGRVRSRKRVVGRYF